MGTQKNRLNETVLLSTQNIREHSAIFSTFTKLPFVFKTFVLSIFEWPLKAGFTVLHSLFNSPLEQWGPWVVYAFFHTIYEA